MGPDFYFNEMGCEKMGTYWKTKWGKWGDWGKLEMGNGIGWNVWNVWDVWNVWNAVCARTAVFELLLILATH